MNWLQIRLFGSVFSSFLPHSYGYEPANELKIVLKSSNFRFSPDRPIASYGRGHRALILVHNPGGETPPLRKKGRTLDS